MRVVVQFTPEDAQALQAGGPTTPALQEALRIITESGGNDLKPVHPGATHALLAPYYTVNVQSKAAADQMIVRLLATAAVVAAYVEPLISLPQDPRH
jgi:hypothetical protein